MPALLINISIAPKFFSIAATPSLVASACVTSKPAADEELHAFLPPVRQLVGRHQRTGDLAGGTDPVDRKTDLVHDGLRPGLAERRRRRISHILR
jgi:hypothetical protein